ncbi:MAG: hypothetical protein PVG22_16510, partial [Chromatiales bacterium]
MRAHIFCLAALLAVSSAAPVCAASDPELAEIHRQLEQMRQDYETRISSLEQRLAEAERAADQARKAAVVADQRAEQAEQLAQQATQTVVQAQSVENPTEQQAQDSAEPIAEAATTPASSYTDFASRFNPAISLVLQGTATGYQNNPEDWHLPGFQLSDETGGRPEGLSLDESEITFSANVDDWFYGQATIALGQADNETEVEVEEAFVDTLALPHGLGMRLGRFYSDVAFQNPIHSHAWDFTDA